MAGRAKIKRTRPGLIESTVESGLPTGIKAFKGLIGYFCGESLCLQESLLHQEPKACGIVNYVYQAGERGKGELRLCTRGVQSTDEK